MVTIGKTTFGPVQLCAFAFAVITALAGLFLTSKREPIPTSLKAGMMLCMVLCSAAFLQTLGAFGAPDVENEEEVDYFEKKKENKERKRQKKADAKADAEAEKEQRKAEKKAQKQAERKALKQAEAAAKRAEEEAAREAEAAAAPTSEEAPKKKKKKKKKKPASVEGATSAAAAPAKKEEKEDESDWVMQPSKKEAWAAKKAASGKLGGPQVTQEMMVNPRHYPAIAPMLARVKETFNVEVDLPRRNSSKEKITFTGSEEGIAQAKNVINEVIDKGYSKTLDGNLSDVTMEVSNIGVLIGPGGSNIHAIQTKTNTRIKTGEKEDRKGAKGGQVTIVGDTNDVSSAVAAIEQLMAEGYSSLTHENFVKETVVFPSALVGVLKGSGGENIKRLQKQTGCRINVPDTKDEAHKGLTLLPLTLVGPALGVDAARQQIIIIQTEHVTRSCDIPLKLIPAFKGQAGAHIQRIQKVSNTRCEIGDHVWDPSMRTVTISGFSKDIQLAEAEVKLFLQSHGSARMDYPVDRIGSLFGKSGASLSELQKRTNTRISVSEHDWDDLVKEITVVGLKTGLEEALRELERLALPPTPKAREPRVENAPKVDADTATEA